MRKRNAPLLASLLSFLLSVLSAPAPAAAASPLSLEGLTLSQLEAVRAEADARIRLLLLPGADGYAGAGDAEELARAPGDHIGEKIRLAGAVFRVAQAGDAFTYYVSPEGNPARVFLVRYTPKAGERLLLPGDEVEALGTFGGASPYTGADTAEEGALLLAADLVTLRVPQTEAPADGFHAATRQDPAPPGAKAVYAGSWWTGYASFEMELLRALRGQAALKKAKELSDYNVMPSRNQEYLLVYVRVRALTAPDGRADIAPTDFSFVSSSGAEYRHHFLIHSTQALRNLFEGGEQEALLACLVDKGDAPLLVFQPESPRPLWFDPNR